LDSVAKQIELYIGEEINKKFTKATLVKATQDAGNEAIKVIRERTDAGISREGKPLPPLSNYPPSGYIQLGKFKVPSYKTIKNNASLLAKAQKKAKGLKSVFKADGSGDQHGRFTGQFFTDMYSKPILISQKKKSIDIVFEVNVKARSAKKIAWLESTTGGTKFFNFYRTVKKYTKPARKIWGLSTAGKWKKIEEKRITDAFNRRLKLDSKIEMIVK
jgi:hypothetical protein